MKYAGTEEVISQIRGEVGRARRKFPDPGGSMTALTEEVGELATALLSEPRDRVIAEAVQVAAVAIRIATEGDPTLDGYRLSIEADDQADQPPGPKDPPKLPFNTYG